MRRSLHEIDAEEIYIYGAQVSVVALFVLLLCQKGRRVVYHTQDFLEPWRHPFRAFLEAMVCRRASHVIVNEINRGRMLQSLYALPKLPHVVPTGLLSDWPVPERSEAKRGALLRRSGLPTQAGVEPVLIIHQGPLRENRCGWELLAALELLPERYRLIVTGMEEEELARMAPELAGRVAALGRMEFQEMLEVTANCDIGVLLYPNDGIGNFYQAPGRLSENCRAGIPSIASDYPSFQQSGSVRASFALCDPASPEDIAKAISNLGGQSGLERKKLGDAARRFALDNLVFDKAMSAVLTVMDDV